jgi:hypothetical protein
MNVNLIDLFRFEVYLPSRVTYLGGRKQWNIDMMTKRNRVEQYWIPRKADISEDFERIWVSLFSGLNVMLSNAAAIRNSSLEDTCAFDVRQTNLSCNNETTDKRSWNLRQLMTDGDAEFQFPAKWNFRFVTWITKWPSRWRVWLTQQRA